MSKKAKLWIFVILNLICLSFIAVDFLWIDVPAVLCLIAAIFIAAFDIYFIISEKNCCKLKIVLSFVGAFVICLIIFASFFYPYWNSTVYKMNVNCSVKNCEQVITGKDAVYDLNYVMKKLKRTHPAFIKEVPSQVMTNYNNILNYFNSKDEISVVDFNLKMESLISCLGDAHTVISPRYVERYYYKDIYKHNQQNDFFTGINGISFKDYLSQNKQYFSYEADSWALQEIGDRSVCLDGLAYLGFDVSDGITYSFETKDGQCYEETAYRDDFVTAAEYYEINNIQNSSDKPFCYYEIDEDKSLVIFTLNECNYNDIYIKTLKEMFAKVKEKGIKNVAVDVRNNGGGSSLVINEFIKYLPVEEYTISSAKVRYGPLMMDFSKKAKIKKNNQYKDFIFNGKVFVLSSSQSFSSAQMFVQWITDNNLGKIIGQSPGNDPNGYGDVIHFCLPKSRFFMQVTHKIFTRVDQTKTERFIEPDYPCESYDEMNTLYSIL